MSQGSASSAVSIITYKIELDYDGSGNVIYFGIADPGTATATAAWQIRKLSYDGSGNLLDVLWANGNKDFTNIWNNRAALGYS